MEPALALDRIKEIGVKICFPPKNKRIIDTRPSAGLMRLVITSSGIFFWGLSITNYKRNSYNLKRRKVMFKYFLQIMNIYFT